MQSENQMEIIITLITLLSISVQCTPFFPLLSG
jgi:hypothetical protein